MLLAAELTYPELIKVEFGRKFYYMNQPALGVTYSAKTVISALNVRTWLEIDVPGSVIN